MLYKKNSAPLTKELFANPTSEYRATPFWAWNCELNQDLLNREIGYMQDMGFGGFHMHVRVGMSTKYLSDDFMKLIKGSVETAKDKKMLAWLYDEDKWPSGFAGGLVTKKKENREKYDIVTSRAVAPLKHLLEYSIPTLKVNGQFISLKSSLEEEIKNINNYYNKLTYLYNRNLPTSIGVETSLYDKLFCRILINLKNSEYKRSEFLGSFFPFRNCAGQGAVFSCKRAYHTIWLPFRFQHKNLTVML